MPKPTRSKPVILVVDDEPQWRTLLQRNVRAAGLEHFAVLCANDGRRALELIETVRPDCILLDYLLPDMDGLELLRAQSQELKSRGIAVVVMSEQDDPSVSAQAIQLGAAHYIKKSELTKSSVLDILTRAMDESERSKHEAKQIEFDRGLAGLLLEHPLPMFAQDVTSSELVYRNAACDEFTDFDSVLAQLNLPVDYSARANYLAELRRGGRRIGQTVIYEGVSYQSLEHLYVDNEYSWLVITLLADTPPTVT